MTEYDIQFCAKASHILNEHHEWPKRGDDLAFGMGQVLIAPCHINLHNTS